MSSRLLSLKEKDLWGDYIKKLPIDQQDVYYTPEYYSLYQNYGDGEALCFVYEEGENIALYPFLKNSINKLGYKLDEEYYDIQGAYGYNGIVTSSKTELFIDNFHKEFTSFCEKNNIVAEFTRFHPLLENFRLVNSEMKTYFDRKTMYLDLSRTYQDVFKNFQKSTRTQINRCNNRYKLELKILNGSSAIEYLDVFCDIYNDAMARVSSDKYLYFNKEYFNNLFSISDKVLLFIAFYEKKAIAAISVLINNNYIHGHLGGSLTEYLNISSFSFLYSEIIKYAIDNKYLFYHGGGGTTSNTDDSLLKFKLNFSSTTVDFFIGKRVFNTHIYSNVIEQWEKKYPILYEKNKVKLLGYREI